MYKVYKELDKSGENVQQSAQYFHTLDTASVICVFVNGDNIIITNHDFL